MLLLEPGILTKLNVICNHENQWTKEITLSPQAKFKIIAVKMATNQIESHKGDLSQISLLYRKFGILSSV